MVAVPVPAGTHTVRLDYTVPGQRKGAAVSLVSLVGLVLMGVTGGLLQRRRRRGEHRRQAAAVPTSTG
jgi:LPXTG-motif cell wall-anchored protein